MTAENCAGVARLKIEAGSDLMKTRKSHPRQRLCENADTTDFSRVEVQFLPNFAASKKAETETPTRLKSMVSKRLPDSSTARLRLKYHRLKPVGICVFTHSLDRVVVLNDLMGPRHVCVLYDGTMSRRRQDLLNSFRQDFTEEVDCPRIARFAKGANRLLAHKLIRMCPRNLNQQRHCFFRMAFADCPHCLYLHLRIAIGTLRGSTQKVETAFTHALTQQTNRLPP